MANPAALTVNKTTANEAIAQPAAQAIDTDGVVPCPVNGESERILIEIVNGDDAALTVKIKAGTTEAAGRRGLGDLSVALSATGGGSDKKIIGGLESARFIQSDGSLSIEFDAATGAPNASVRVYQLPRNV